MSSSRSIVLALVLTITLAGCADVEPVKTAQIAVKPEPGKALVYFYRLGRFVGSMRGIEISDHGAAVGDLSNGSYFVFQASPGPHQFAGNGHDEEAGTIILAAGHTYYFRCTIEVGMWLPHYSVTNVSAEQAANDMAGLQQVHWLGH